MSDEQNRTVREWALLLGRDHEQLADEFEGLEPVLIKEAIVQSLRFRAMTLAHLSSEVNPPGSDPAVGDAMLSLICSGSGYQFQALLILMGTCQSMLHQFASDDSGKNN